MANVFEVSLSHRAHHLVALVHAIGVSEGLVALVDLIDADVLTEESLAIDVLRNVEPSEVQYGGAEVDEADESFYP